MTDRTVTSTAAAPAASWLRYQAALRRVAVATLIVTLPGAGALVRAGPDNGRLPQVSR